MTNKSETLFTLLKKIDQGLKKKFDTTNYSADYTIYCNDEIADIIDGHIGDMNLVRSDHHDLKDQIIIHGHNHIIDGFNNPINLGPLTFSK